MNSQTHDLTNTLGTITNAWKKLADGDPAGADVLWDRYFAVLVQLARKRTGDKLLDQAEDIAADALWKVVKDKVPEKYSGVRRDEIRALLLTITVQLAVSAWRKDKGTLRRGKHFTKVDEAEVTKVISQEPTAEQAASYAELIARIRSHPKMSGFRLAIFEMILEGTKLVDIARNINDQEDSKRITEAGIRHHRDAIRQIVLQVAPNLFDE